MVQVSRRTGVTGSALVRLLARLTDIEVPESRQGFADRMSLWLRWTDAISLSAALDGRSAGSHTLPPASASAEEREFARVRTALANAIADDGAPAVDFPSHRRRYLARQQAMEAAIGPLRGRLRRQLAAGTPAMARLAAVDEVMEQVLGGHEQRLLATVPALLQKHFERSRPAATAPADEARDAGAAADANGTSPGRWLAAFRQDMQDVLRAELEIRLQPVEGLLEALRMR